jgi:RecB family endonuclease NucS
LNKGLEITAEKEQKVPSGFIDITAKDKNGDTVVIELKAGKADREAIGQILGYMGDLATGKNLVRGILVASDFDLSAVAAVRVVPHLQLRKYGFNFTFVSVGSEQRSVATR